MKTNIYYYTGTGNSLWTARTLAENVGDAEIYSLAENDGSNLTNSAPCIGLVFPVHIWGVPGRVMKFLDASSAGMHPEYLFAVAVNAGQVANTLVQLRKVLAANGKTLSAGWEITLPSNYIPWGGPGPQEEQQKRFETAEHKLRSLAEHIKKQESSPVETGPLWQRLIFSGLAYPMSFPQVPKMDQKFKVDEKCNHCEICQKVCPTGNVTLQDGKPIWNRRCEQCFACLQWCPQEAIQYGQKTPQYQRYHHPEIKLKDMLGNRVQKRAHSDN